MLQKVLAAVAVIGLLFVRGGLCQCFTNTDCSGDVVSAAGQRDCCVRTECGLSFNTGSDCKICIVHGFNRSHYYVLEEERLDTVFQLNVKGTSPLIDDLIITGIITAAADGTASDSDFQGLAPIPVRNRVDIRLFTANDEITLEYDDRVLLTFTPDNSALIPGIEGLGEYIRDTATVHIIDNDQLQINFGEADYRIEEGSGMLITITLQFRENQNPFTVILTPVTVDEADSLGLGFFINSDTIGSSSRATAGDDFSHDGTIVTVPENSRTFQIPQFFTIVDDNIDEDEQSFVIVAEIGDDVPDKFAIGATPGFNTSVNISCFQLGVGERDCHGRRGATEIRIDDNDPMIIGFTERIQNVSEGQEGAVDLFPLEINVSSVRTAERVHPMLFRLLEVSTNATVEPLIAESNIFDATFGLRANPGDPLQETRDLSPGERIISPLLQTSIRNDFVSEDPLKCYTIRILPVDVPGRRELFTCNDDSAMADNYFCEHTICITDDDEPFEVTFVEKTYTVGENMGGVNVCVNLTIPETDILDETVQVSVIDYPSSVHIPVGAPLATPDPPDFISRYLMEEGSDYAQQTMAVNVIDDILISQLMRLICYNQPIYDDPCVELDEYAGLSLRVPEGTISPPPCDQSSILILDNDRAVVGLDPTLFDVSENVSHVQLCAVVSEPDITCPIKFPFEVELSTSDETAVQSMDYGAINVALMFEACEKRKCVNVNITDDIIPEQNESFTYHLRRTPDLHERISLNPVDGRVNITDNDDPITVGYDPTSYMTTESARSVTLTIRVFSHPTTGAPQPFTLVVNTQDGTATVADGDYVPVAGEIVQFNAGDVTRTHTIFINDDDECEKDPNEILFSRIALENSIPGITVTVPRAEVTINDTAEPECEPITVGYDPDSYVTTETDGSVTLNIRVFSHPAGAPRPFTLVVNTEDGTATVADGDYGPVSGQIIQFNAGDVTQPHTITINNDDVCEIEPANENFLSNIALDSGIPDITVTIPRAMVTIDDIAEPECEPITVGYDPDSYVTTETAGSVTLNIRVFNHSAGAPRPFTLVVNTEDGTATVADGDYGPVSGQIIQFNAGDVTQPHTITINNDGVCENEPNENFFSNIALDSGIPDITVTVPRAMVTIDDTAELKCDPNTTFVNDTLTGDPLLTVPIFTNPNVEPGDDIESLCYEVHGEDSAYFNLISDGCTSVNGYYQEAVTPSENIDLNVVTQIGVRARGNSACWNIQVDLDMCNTTVNGMPLASTTNDGISVKHYATSSRVRIAVPNCDDDTMLVMWVFCRSGRVEDHVTREYFSIRFIRFVVMRGLNLDEQSHGLIGQFWNVPVTISSYTGFFGGEERTDDYIITVDHPQSDPRSFVGLKSDVTWEFEKRVCYYVGNTQAGKLAEVADPNDSVIEGDYNDYKVDSLFATDFKYSHFDETQC